MYLGLNLSIAAMTSTSSPGHASHKNQSVDLYPGFTLEKPGELSKTPCPQRTAEQCNRNLSGVGSTHQHLRSSEVTAACIQGREPLMTLKDKNMALEAIFTDIPFPT